MSLLLVPQIRPVLESTLNNVSAADPARFGGFGAVGFSSKQADRVTLDDVPHHDLVLDEERPMKPKDMQRIYVSQSEAPWIYRGFMTRSGVDAKLPETLEAFAQVQKDAITAQNFSALSHGFTVYVGHILYRYNEANPVGLVLFELVVENYQFAANP